MRKILGLGLVLGLAGCADANHDAAFRYENEHRVKDIAALRQTYVQQQLDHSYDVIRAKLTLSEQYDKHGSPCTGRIGNATPSPEEQAALRRWTAQRVEFLNQLTVLAKPVADMPDRLKSMSERFDQMKFEEEAKVTVKLDDLSQGRITYCQFAEANKAINLEAHKIAQEFLNQLSEEALLDAKRRAGYLPYQMVYTAP